MKIGERDLVVEIVDESANGFSIEVDGGLGCEVGQVALLGNASGWTEVRVVNARPQRSVEGDELEGQTSDNRMRLGLLRLRDLESSEVEEERPAPFSWGEVFKTICPLAPLGWVLGVAACLIFGASLIFVLVWTLEHKEASDHMLSIDAPPPRAAGDDSRPPFAGAVQGTARRAPEPARPRGHARSTKAVAEKSNPASPIESILKPADKESLALSREQFQRLQQSFDEYQTTTDRAASAQGRGHASSGADDPKIQLGQRCLEIFTEKQRGSLMRLLAQSGSLFKSEAMNRLALTRDQLSKLQGDFNAYEAAVKGQIGTTPDGVSPLQTDDAEIQFGRHSLALLTEKQRGALMRLAMTDLLRESNLPSHRELSPRT
jgi:hypothetical protein